MGRGMSGNQARARLDRLWQRGRAFLGTDLAILGGAVTWVSERHLVGVLAGGAMAPDALGDEIAGTRALTGRPFGVNLITMHPDLDRLIEVVIDHRVGHIVLAGGLPPAAAVKRIREAGAKVLCFAPAL